MHFTDADTMMLIDKALHGLASHYLSELLTPYAPNHRLLSLQSNLLVVPQTCLKPGLFLLMVLFFGTLPLEHREALEIFKTQLKTYFLD